MGLGDSRSDFDIGQLVQLSGNLLFITHPEVVIDPNVPVPQWPLSERGIERMEAFASSSAVAQVGSVYSSDEQKAKDGARILASVRGIEPKILSELHENDRSATGFLPPDEFWPVVETFFARPEQSVRGWERSIDAQRRIATAVERIRRDEQAAGDIAIVAHGGVGALLLSRLTEQPISRRFEQPVGTGGCYLTIARATGTLVEGWRPID